MCMSIIHNLTGNLRGFVRSLGSGGLPIDAGEFVHACGQLIDQVEKEEGETQ